ncbi:MAG: amidohydrolase/deacetylase family metallohydrolase [Rhodobacteraceae bacterium]|nr:amidohydrolase/deacetylase family metallohydrolase [Paracoccaceae bacterium]
MALTIKNFHAIGLDASATEIHVDHGGYVVELPVPGAEVVDADGAFLSPGWCDLHVHVWHGGTDISVRVDEAGRRTGVTAMADAGSAGEANFHGLREYVIDPAAETIRAFVNIGSIGLVACNRVSELIDLRSIDIDRTLAVIEANRDVICGIKVRASGVIVGTWGVTPLKIAKRVGEIARLPLMVHVGEPPPLIDEVLPLLTEGDVVTHCFNGKSAGSIADTDDIWRMARAAADRGVLMDVGHGVASFDFSVARRALNEGFEPFAISTDLHRRNIDGPVHDMALTVSKLHALGMSLEACIAAITERPRGFLGLPATHSAIPGARADFTMFRVANSNLTVVDSMGKTLVLRQVFEPTATVIGGSHLLAETRRPKTEGRVVQ